MTEKHKVKILPSGNTYIAEHKENLLDFIIRTNHHLNASCGGFGACGKCKVKLVEGKIEHSQNVDYHHIEEGYILACQSFITGDATIEIPLESQINEIAFKERENITVLTASYNVIPLDSIEADPLAFKIFIEMEPPKTNDSKDDASRITHELKKFLPQKTVKINLEVLKKLPSTLRSSNWKVTVTIVDLDECYEMINIEPDESTFRQYALAVDVGTTTVCGRLIHMGLKGKKRATILAEASDYNAQISYGDDVITRIFYSKKGEGLKRLQEAVVKSINKIVDELTERTDISATDITHVVCAGNTTMTHLLLGIDPQYLMLEPYTPCFLFPPVVKANEIGIKLSENTPVFIFPCVASYVGGDIVSGIISSGISKESKLNLFIDIGTNGEIVLSGSDWMICASCSAGPAFEGGGIKHGMRATKGAIEQIRIDPVTFEPRILTIGHTKPSGICGSGLIDCFAEMFITGLITQNGKINKDLDTHRIRAVDGIYEYVICYGNETQTGKDITITEPDLDNLMRAKAAMFAGCKVLLDTVGLSFSEIDRIIIAGGFGHFINPYKAQIIGLLPEIPLEKIYFIGNASLHGATLYSVSKAYKNEAEKVARMLTNIELSNNKGFMDEYIAAMFIPHTNERLFPHVLEKINQKNLYMRS